MNPILLMSRPSDKKPNGAFLSEQICTIGFAKLKAVQRMFLQLL
jgi:hypothetical protein